jgi:DNA adenine methylase
MASMVAPAAPAAAPVSPRDTPRPFLKWAGGKQQLVPALLEGVPSTFGRYFEPFVGGGALFFALAGRGTLAGAVLADANADLMATYEVVRDDLSGLARRLRALERRYLALDADRRAAHFYRVRVTPPRDRLGAAARFIFLNKTCFNGLYRVNRSGQFNVPHGRYVAPRILDLEVLRAASSALAGVELRCADFEAACADAAAGDFVYFDPPFHPLSSTSSFTQYTSADFGWADQERLRVCIDGLTSRGVHVLLSDSPHPLVTYLYESAGYELRRVPARRAINSKGDGRGPIEELLVTNATRLSKQRRAASRRASPPRSRESGAGAARAARARAAQPPATLPPR